MSQPLASSAFKCVPGPSHCGKVKRRPRAKHRTAGDGLDQGNPRNVFSC
jgi:hypothetical protein